MVVVVVVVVGSLVLVGGERLSLSLTLVIGLTRDRRCGVQTPPGHNILSLLLGLAKLYDAGLLRNCGALMLRSQLWHKLGGESAGFLGVEITSFLGNINYRGCHFVVTLLRSLLKGTASSTDLHRKLLTGGVSHELTRLLLHVLGATGRLVDSPALLRTLAITNLLYRFVTFLNCFINSLLFEGDGALLLKVLLADLLLGGFKLSDVGVVALLSVLVSALQYRLLLQGGDCLLLVHTAQPSLRVLHTAAEVDSPGDFPVLLPAIPGLLAVTVVAVADEVCPADRDQQT